MPLERGGRAALRVEVFLRVAMGAKQVLKERIGTGHGDFRRTPCGVRQQATNLTTIGRDPEKGGIGTSFEAPRQPPIRQMVRGPTRPP